MRYTLNEAPDRAALCDLREAAGYGRAEGDYPRAFASLSTTVAAYDGSRLVGWCAAVGDGVRHAFLVDVIVHPALERKGIGRELVARAVAAESRRGASLVHADFAPDRAPFYERCGFRLCGGGVREVPAAAPLGDAEFLARFEDRTLPFELWTHRAHIKVAYLYLRRFPLAEATARARAGIRAYNAKNRVPEGPHMGYHETLTCAWMRIVDAMIRTHGPAATADEFCDEQPYLTSRLLLRLFYSRDRIMAPEAKIRFVEPDLAPFPR
jgi:GNAT superfamily N-acetyltransferase